jgi:hypothetical protein
VNALWVEIQPPGENGFSNKGGTVGYVEQSLSSGERVILKARLHWGMFIGPLFGIMAAMVFILLSMIPFMVSYYAISGIEGLELSRADFNTIQPLAGSCCFGCGALWLLGALLNIAAHISLFFTTEFAVTNKRVIGKSGALRRRSLEIMLSKIESVRVDEPFLGRLLNYGTIIVKGSGGTAQPFPFISDAMALRMQINNLLPTSG